MGAGPGPAWPERIFYQSATWLETSPAVQRLSLRGVLRGWEEVAMQSEGEPASPRLREFVRLHACLAARADTLEELLERLARFGARRPGRTYYSLADFVGEGLRELCAPRRPR